MRAHTIPYARLPKRFPPFFVAWMEGDPRAGGLLPAAPFDREAIRACAVERLAGTFPRREIADALAERHRALGSPPAVLQRIESLRSNDTFCVVAGQQPLLAGGPLFVVYKVLTLLALAREIESRLGFRCVPLFWNHSDDHDIREADRIGVVDRENALLTLRAGFPEGRRPLREVESAEKTEGVRKALADSLPETSFRPAILDLLGATLAPGPAAWFTRLLTRLFGAEGLVVFEPHWVAREAAPILSRVVRAPALAADALRAGAQALARAGYPSPLEPAGTGLFLVQDGLRARLDADASAFTPAGGGAALRPEDLSRILDEQPERVTPGVALRPAVQDAIFPTLAVVAGPNEAAYLAQLGALYNALGVFRPAVVPRASATIVEPKVAAAAEKCGASYEAVLQGVAAAPPLPAGLVEAFDAAKRDIAAALERLAQATAGIEPGLERRHAKTRARALESIDLYARKTAEAAARTGDTASRQFDKLRVHLTPGGELQERTTTGLYYLTLFGPNFYARLGERLDFTARGHQVVVV